MQLDAPILKHRMYVFGRPHLYDLARLNDRYRRYAAVVADTNSARLFVFGMKKTLSEQDVANPKVSRTKVGGWSQARYQRHTANFHLHHAKELVEELERTVREDEIDIIVLAGDEVIIPVLLAQLPASLAAKTIDVLSWISKLPSTISYPPPWRLCGGRMRVKTLRRWLRYWMRIAPAVWLR